MIIIVWFKEEYAFDNANWRAAYIFLTEFDNLWPEHEYAGHKLQGKTNKNPEFTVTTEKTRFVPCLLLYICFFLGSKNMKPSFYCIIKFISLPSLSFCTCFPYYKNSKKSSPKSSITFSAGTVVSTFSLFWYWSFYQLSKSSSRDNAN